MSLPTPPSRLLYTRAAASLLAATKKAASGTTKRKAESATKRKAASGTTKRKAGFGSYRVSFAGRKETAEEIFGKAPLTPSQLPKKIWDYVKSNGLSSK